MRIRNRFFPGLAAICCIYLSGQAAPDLASIIRKTSVPTHPRLLLSEERLDAIRQCAKTDSLMNELLETISDRAKLYRDAPPQTFPPSDSTMVDSGRRALGRILVWSFEYRLSGDRHCANAAKEELLTVCAFPSWYHHQYLGGAEMTLAVAIGYDWLYNDLSPEERNTIRIALIEKCLAQAPDAYGTGKKWVGWSATENTWLAENNYNQVVNTGYLAAALALRDEEPDLAQLAIEGVIRSLPNAMKHYAPDGAWAEGPTYWHYGTSYNVLALALLQNAFGTLFDLTDAPGVSKTANFAMQIFGPTGTALNFGDCGEGSRSINVGAGHCLTWLAQTFDQPQWLITSRERLRDNIQIPPRSPAEYGQENRFLVFNALWFPEAIETPAQPQPLDAHFRGPSNLAIFRSQANDPNALWIGFKAGTNSWPHGQLDLGSFVLESDGVRWAVDLGPDNYSLPGYWDYTNGGQRWNSFHCNSLSHNILSLGPDLQDATAEAKIIDFQSTPATAFAIADLTPAFPGQAKQLLRGVAMLDRSRILIQDEIHGAKRNTPLDWHMLTRAKIRLSDKGQTAVLSQDGQELEFRIIAGFNPAVFSIEPVPPRKKGGKPAKGVQFLRITYPLPQADECLAVLVTPPRNASLPDPKVIPLADWVR